MGEQKNPHPWLISDVHNLIYMMYIYIHIFIRKKKTYCHSWRVGDVFTIWHIWCIYMYIYLYETKKRTAMVDESVMFSQSEISSSCSWWHTLIRDSPESDTRVHLYSQPVKSHMGEVLSHESWVMSHTLRMKDTHWSVTAPSQILGYICIRNDGEVMSHVTRHVWLPHMWHDSQRWLPSYVMWLITMTPLICDTTHWECRTLHMCRTTHMHVTYERHTSRHAWIAISHVTYGGVSHTSNINDTHWRVIASDQTLKYTYMSHVAISQSAHLWRFPESCHTSRINDTHRPVIALGHATREIYFFHPDPWQLKCVAMCCSVLRFVAVGCSVAVHFTSDTRVCMYYTNARVYCNTLRYTATHCNTVQSTDGWDMFMQIHVCTATHCNTLQHTTAHCNTLQHTATHCNTLQHTVIVRRDMFMQIHVSTATHCNTYCSTLQHTAAHCSTLQYTDRRDMFMQTRECTATHCNTLQHKQALFNSQMDETCLYKYACVYIFLCRSVLQCTFLCESLALPNMLPEILGEIRKEDLEMFGFCWY